MPPGEEYLYSEYALWTPPSEFLRWASDTLIAPVLAPVYAYLTPLQAKLLYRGKDEYEYASAVAEAKAEIYDEISSRPVVICECYSAPCVVGGTHGWTWPSQSSFIPPSLTTVFFGPFPSLL